MDLGPRRILDKGWGVCVGGWYLVVGLAGTGIWCLTPCTRFTRTIHPSTTTPLSGTGPKEKQHTALVVAWAFLRGTGVISQAWGSAC